MLTLSETYNLSGVNVNLPISFKVTVACSCNLNNSNSSFATLSIRRNSSSAHFFDGCSSVLSCACLTVFVLLLV